MQNEEPLLPSPVIRALLTETYEKAERSRNCYWGKKLAKVKEENVGWGITGYFLGAVSISVVLVPVFAILS